MELHSFARGNCGLGIPSLISCITISFCQILRESPVVELIERLIGKGYELRVYDRNVNLARLVGANRDYILNRIPHIAALMVEDMDDAIKDADVVVIGNGDPEFRDVPERLAVGQHLVDLVRVDEAKRSGGSYDGICW